MDDENIAPEPANDSASGRSTNEREWIEHHQIGRYTVQATFAEIDGQEIPWAVRVDVVGDDLLIKLGGRNALAHAIIIAEALRRNPIRD